MTLQTSGAFGGLGIVISIRDQMLTVMNPMPGTRPAGRAFSGSTASPRSTTSRRSTCRSTTP